MFWERRNFGQKALDAIFCWLNGVVTEKDAILVETSGRKSFFYFDFPLRHGDKPKKTKSPPQDREVSFIVRKPQSGNSFLQDDWITVFSSPEWKIFEKKTRFSRSFPLRWRLDEEEKKTALKIARDALEKFLAAGLQSEQEYFNGLPRRFYLKTCLDVALWVQGQLRGSAVVENSNLGEGIAEAAILASRDVRFKPLSREELRTTRIEITIIQNPFVPLSGNELKRNQIYPDKGYFLRKGGQKGWFLPEVFNVRRFSNLDEFLSELGYEKAHLSRDGHKSAEVFVFETDDFIESENHVFPITLWGPTAQGKRDLVRNPESLRNRLHEAADWLCEIQEADGNIPSIISVFGGRQKQIDWPRLAFTGWSLAEFGKAIGEKRHLNASEKVFDYLEKYLLRKNPYLESFSHRIPGYTLAIGYFAKLALSLEKRTDALTAAGKIFELQDDVLLEPIARSHIAGIFKALGGANPVFSKYFENIANSLKKNFEENVKSGRPMNLAVWAELVNIFSDFDDEFSSQVVDWLKKRQLPGGAFPESTVSGFVYVRGTGKVFEILALEPEENKEEIRKTLDWLFSMQYDDENTFFVTEEIRPRVIGGFRHDYFNSEAWIDAAGHILLGGTRLILSKKNLTNE